MSRSTVLAMLAGAMVVASGAGASAAAAASTDVVIAFDTTGSMDSALDESKAEIRNVIAEIDSRFPDVRYAVASVKDYGSSYGDTGEEPWDLRQPLTGDRDKVQTAIDGLVADGGGDGPEAYGRAVYEADRDPAIGFRPGSRRLTVLVADNVPHDDDLNQGIPEADQTTSSPFDTGVDPGRDELFSTPDDIDWQAELADLKARSMPLYFVLFKGDDTLLPYWRAWARATGGSAFTAGSGALAPTLVQSISAGANGCGRDYRRIGSIDLCADAITPQADGTLTATGNLVLDGGVGVGDGPATVDGAATSVTVPTPAPITVNRVGGPVRVATAAFVARGDDVKDEISGREHLSTLELQGTGTAVNLTAGGVGFALGGKAYLDRADGGGVVLAAHPLFDLLKQVPTGQFAVGAHAGSDRPVRILGGSVGWSGIPLPGRKTKAADVWKIGGTLSYDGAADTWKLEGEAEFPKVIQKVGGAKVSGALKAGRIDAVGITATFGAKGIPLGSSGFFLDSFGGEVSGFSQRTKTLKLGVTGGYGPKLPLVDKHLLDLEKGEISVSTDLSGSIKGTVGIVDRRLAGGDLDVSMALEPRFRASGALNASVSLLGTGYYARTRIDMDPDHFTATGGAELRIAGRTTNGANAIISDEGTGASGKACAICPTVGVGIRWRNVLSFPPKPEWIGADIDRYRTIRQAGASGPVERGVTVPPGTGVLAVYGDAAGDGPTDVQLVAPGGAVLTPGPDAAVDRTPDGRTAVTVLRPKPGRWRIRAGGDVALESQVVPPLGTLAAVRVGPRGTAARPLRRGAVRVRWVPRDVPVGTRVIVLRSTRPGRAGTRVATAGAARRGVVIPVRALAKGANRLTLVLQSRGIPFRRIAIPGPVRRR